MSHSRVGTCQKLHPQLSSNPNRPSSNIAYRSERLILETVSDQNTTPCQSSSHKIQEMRMQQNINLSFEGLFSRIQALKEQHTAPNTLETKQTQNNYFQRFPKLRADPNVKNKTALKNKSPTAVPIDSCLPVEKFAPKQINLTSSFGNKFTTTGLLGMPNMKDSVEIKDEVPGTFEGRSQAIFPSKLETLISKSVEEVDFRMGFASQPVKSLTIGDFSLGKCIGSGKFGDVYMCRHKASGWLFGMKKIFKSTILEHGMVEQFAKELKIHYSLSHPNIIKLYAHFQDDYHIFLLMEYAEGGVLMQKLKSPEEQVAKYISETIEAVGHLHRSNIAHRDIKPENIVLQLDTVKLCDFGWASVFTDSMKTTFCGTLDYLSPQMRDRGSYDTSVDVWAIGILTFELLTGSPPFKKEMEMWKEKRGGTKWLVEYPLSISTVAEGFMRSILKEEPGSRASLRLCLKHAFLRRQGERVEQKYYSGFGELL